MEADAGCCAGRTVELLMSARPIVEGRPCGGDPGVTLTTLGSRGVKVRVEDSPMRDAGPGDKTVWLDLFDGPLAVTFTASEVAWLAGQLRPTAGEDRSTLRR